MCVYDKISFFGQFLGVYRTISFLFVTHTLQHKVVSPYAF